MSKTGYIYLIGNDINNEVYIESTIQNVHKRFQEHINSKNPSYLHNYIKQIGKEHFFVKILKTVKFNDIFELFEEEQKLIKNYGTLNSKEKKPRRRPKRPITVLSAESHDFIIPEESFVLEKAREYNEFMNFEKFINLFLDEKTISLLDFFNSHEEIKINVAFLNWLGYSDKRLFEKVLIKNNISYNTHIQTKDTDTDKTSLGILFEDNKNERKIITIKSDYIMDIMRLSSKKHIKYYFNIINKMVKYYSIYFDEKIKCFSLNTNLKYREEKNNISLNTNLNFTGDYTPKKAHKEDAGLDLQTLENFSLKPMERKLVDSGVCIQVPENHVGYIMSRSGLSHKHGVVVLNAPGVIDCNYTGKIFINLINFGNETVDFVKGMKIAQFVLHEIPVFNLNKTDKLIVLDNCRKEEGFGSSGI